MLEILINKEISLKEAREKAITYAKERHVERSVIMTVAGAANCNIDYHALDGKGESGMWSIFEETKKEGKAEGKAEMILAMLKAGYPYDEIMKISGMTENEVRLIEEELLVAK